jgi:hypothetical protein
MAAQDPINHHYLPIFYQDGWATGGRVIRYYRPHEAVVASPTGMKYTGCEEYLYSMNGLPSGTSQALETQFFSPIDSLAATSLQKMLAGGLNQMTNDDRVNWTRFMLSTQLRNPHGLDELKQRWRRLSGKTPTRKTIPNTRRCARQMIPLPSMPGR